ncbi:PilW family protein [Pseudomonas sp. BGr12]|uniref:PilW family protein n=1 Tax=Pseudomonas sp. BGr12 TaxID=2936269 RepID=UPI00255A10FF|nr:PilW family protein [Pseudomonas sp. BJa5]MDL2426634.1 PilW family protein [Pseudomonas sp. BJa5]
MSGVFRHRGFTLIEVMIAVAISLLIMVAVLTLYLNLRRTSDDMAKTNSLIENGRFAVGLLQEDLAHAGFWNGYVPQFDDLTATDPPADYPTALPPVCSAFSTWTQQDRINSVGIAAQTFSAVPPGCSAIVTNLASNSDVLVVRHVDTCSPGVGNCDALAAGKVYFQSSFCKNETLGAFVLDTTGFTLTSLNCLTIAERRKFVIDLYYVRDYAVSAGDGIPTLVRSTFDLSGGATPANALQAAVPLIEGVEAFRVELGLDSLSKSNDPTDYLAAPHWDDPNTRVTVTNRGDGSPDGSFVHCGASSCTLDQLANVVEARLYVLARARARTAGYTSDKTYALGGSTLGPFTDGYKRHLFTSSATLVNISRRRQTP